jgi:hypothetical protein
VSCQDLQYIFTYVIIAQVLFELYGTISMVMVKETQGVVWCGAKEGLMLTGKQTMMVDSLQSIVFRRASSLHTGLHSTGHL